MFKKYLFCILAISFCFSTNTIYTNNFNLFEIENIDEYTLEVTVNIGEINFNDINVNHEIYTLVSLNSSYPSQEIGNPNLPMLNKIIEIPRGADIRVEIIEDNISTYNLVSYWNGIL